MATRSIIKVMASIKFITSFIVRNKIICPLKHYLFSRIKSNYGAQIELFIEFYAMLEIDFVIKYENDDFSGFHFNSKVSRWSYLILFFWPMFTKRFIRSPIELRLSPQSMDYHHSELFLSD